MKAKIIDGKALANTIKEELRQEVENIKSRGGNVPHLAAILVGDNPASQSYVRNKIRSCEQSGFESTTIRLADTITQEELLEVVKRMNEDKNIDGYIVQLPLPKHINEDVINLAIDPNKDVDGFHPTNFGKSALGLPSYLPATPGGILEMIKRYEIETKGKHCVVLGRSNIVGKPISILMAQKGMDCTVTLTHSRTRNLREETLRADIIIAAIGIPNFLTADMVKEDVVIIDVGINQIDAPERKRGYKLVGDAEFDEIAEKASYITPVPGGVGPMTVAYLLINTLKASQKEK